jgi:hypothetical protein
VRDVCFLRSAVLLDQVPMIAMTTLLNVAPSADMRHIALTSVVTAVVARKMTPCNMTVELAHFVSIELNRRCQSKLAGSSLPKRQVFGDVCRSYEVWALTRAMEEQRPRIPGR